MKIKKLCHYFRKNAYGFFSIFISGRFRITTFTKFQLFYNIFIDISWSINSGNYENHFEYLMNYSLLLMTVSSLDEVDLMELQFSDPRHIFNVLAPDIGVIM